jgi:DNA uptake protein ComE-like DNA-binding protein
MAAPRRVRVPRLSASTLAAEEYRVAPVDASQGNGIVGRTPQPPGPMESDDLEDWPPPEASPHGGDAAPDPELELERVREDLQRMEEYAWACEERAERAERELAQMRERAASMKQAAARAAAARYPASAGAEGEGEDPNLNQISFEALRSLGLTVNQAARVISVRDQVGGFASVDGLDAVRGLPGEIREKLKDLGSA